MADEPTAGDSAPDAVTEGAPDAPPPEPPETAEVAVEQEQQKRNTRGLAGVIAVIVIIVVVLFLLRDCGRGDGRLDDGDGTKTIESVEGAAPVPGAVSVWISEGTTLEQALAESGVEAGDFLALGRGRYIVQVTEGTEVRTAASIAAQPGVFDAGLVYDTDAE